VPRHSAVNRKSLQAFTVEIVQNADFWFLNTEHRQWISTEGSVKQAASTFSADDRFEQIN
jgi:hypothetical protein